MDYTDFGVGVPPNQNGLDNRWWKVEKKDRARALSSTIQLLAQYDTQRQTNYRDFTNLYGNVPMMGTVGLQLAAAQPSAVKDRVTYNLIQSLADTVVAKMASNKPKPLFMTKGGNWETHRKAEKLNTFTDGVFYENKAYDHMNLIMRDAEVWGDGFTHVFDHYGRVKFERTLANELFVDWLEAFYGNPRQLHHAKGVDRDCLIELFPKHKSEIMDCPLPNDYERGSMPHLTNQLMVVSSWHLPSGPDADDGLWSINIGNCTLQDRPWKKQFFPFAQYQPIKKLFGFFGQGIPERQKGKQWEINKILYMIQRSYHLGSTFKILLAAGSKIVQEHLNNEIGAIIEYVDTPPQYITPPLVPQEIYHHLLSIIQKGYEEEGVSQLSASAQKPPGLDSGKALREYHDIENDRNTTREQALDRYTMDLAKLSIDCAKDIYEREKTYKVMVPGKKFFHSVDWKEIDLDEDEYILKMFPVSRLPDDPAAQLQTIQEYAQAGWISQRTAKRLCDFPDLQQVEDLQNAEEEYLNMILGQIVDHGEYTEPEPEDELQLAMELCLEYYAQGKLHGLSEKRLAMLLKFKAQVQALQQKAALAAAQNQAALQAAANPASQAPGALPEPAPQSDLIPNNPAMAG